MVAFDRVVEQLRRRRRRIAALLAVAALVACDSGPAGPEFVPCELMAFAPAIVAPGVTGQALAPVLEDAATRIAPVLVEAGAPPALAEGFSTLALLTSETDPDGACRAFNLAAEAANQLASSAPPAMGPDIGAIRLALGLSHAWLSTTS